MKIVIGNTSYTELKNLTFSPSTDLVNDRLSIDEVIADIVTESYILTGAWAELQDDNGTRWFYGYISYAENEQDHIKSIRISSELGLLARKIMPAKMYSAESLSDAIAEVTSGTGATVSIGSGASGTLTGYCPEQDARERLQHILFATGLYCKTTFVSHPTVAQLDTSSVYNIPYDVTYWKPKRTYDDYVTAIKVAQYSFAEGTPETGDDYVEADGHIYIVSRTDLTLNNQNVPEAVNPNVLVYDSVMLVNNSNSSLVATTLALYYFNRQKVEFECINNGEYTVGNKYNVMINDSEQSVGYAESCDFTFGTQTKARMVIAACLIIPTVKLIVQYISKDNPPGELRVAERYFQFPEGASFEITTEYIDVTMDGFQYVFRPDEDTVTGTMGSSETTVQVDCYVALRKEMSTGALEIISVDEVERTEHGSGSDITYEAEIS